MTDRPLHDNKVLNDDIRKCGEEIKQYRNQQFILGTTALGLFGAYTVFVEKYSRELQGDPALFLWTGIATLVLFAFLFRWMRGIRHWLIVTAVWLEINAKSTWEYDMRNYYEKHKISMPSHTGLAAYSFLITGLGVFLLTLIVSPLPSIPDWKLAIFVVAFSVYEMLIYYFGTYNKGITSEIAHVNWIDVMKCSKAMRDERKT
jgi:drug/metabolite transporter (DMT)-like permease